MATSVECRYWPRLRNSFGEGRRKVGNPHRLPDVSQKNPDDVLDITASTDFDLTVRRATGSSTLTGPSRR
jgi:hypothetical protein